MCQPVYNKFTKIGNAGQISVWKFIELSNEIMKLTVTSDNILSPSLSYIDVRPRV